ncbi:MAG: ferrous iron transport protein A [Erysipelotrichaceae bacterium]|nr:ferrous iron transport protein A [Erysipelotrichaceae bacterium]MBQ1533655.1 ferrous iron transport protein A [Erysipelotrichaceae bacterium]MBQ1787811.1 ferrous iron transport protein A [Erysipelotrichaceae bacterium]MBQ5804478.1 ferrous iron transport protein A [Erysipelotrichaceae bacterium]MBQ6126431.1 ferrous iron transport protein A [Erysipelotrichaceae bacterium]
MLPLTYANVNEMNVIRKVGGNPEIKKHLEDMGFVTGAVVTVVSAISGNLIVNVKDSKVALDKQLAGKIMI